MNTAEAVIAQQQPAVARPPAATAARIVRAFQPPRLPPTGSTRGAQLLAQHRARQSQAEEARLAAGDPRINIIPEAQAVPAYLLNREEGDAQLATPAELRAAARNARRAARQADADFERIMEVGRDYLRRQQAEGHNRTDWSKYDG